MPHAALLVMTSPMLLGPAPMAGAVEAGVAVAPAIASEVPTPQPHNLLPLSWSLAASQDQPQDPGTEQPAEEQDADDSEIIVQGEYGPPDGDPMAAVNETSYQVSQQIDAVLVEPASTVYRDVFPDPLRDGVGNFVRNLREPANFLNFLLQLKVGDAFETLGRFAINSTIGVGGLFDVAKRDGINLPYRQNGFANTLGYYGVGNGTYLFLPITGPTTPRDLIGNTLDQLLLPTIIGRPYTSPEYAIPLFVVANLDSRLEIDEELERIGDTVDPYATRRDLYLWRRERDIALIKGEEVPPRPQIVREIEDGLDAVEGEDDSGIEPSAPPIMEDGASDDAPLISYQDTLEMPSLAAAITITRPRTRLSLAGVAEPATR